MNTMTTGSRPQSAYFWLTLAPIFWGGNFVAGHYLGQSLSAPMTNLLRWLIALCILGPFLGPMLIAHRREVVRNAPRLIVLGALGVAGFNTVLYEGLAHANVSIAAIAFAATPVLIAVLAAALERQLPTPRLAAATLISLAGMVMAQSDALSQGVSPRGVAFVLAAAVIWAVYSVALRRQTMDAPAGAAFFAQIIAGTVLSVPIVWLSDGLVRPRVSLAEATALLYLGVFAAALAFWLWQRGVAAVGPAQAGVFMNIVPIASLTFGWALLGEALSAREIAAFLVVLSGVALATIPRLPSRTIRRGAIAALILLAPTKAATPGFLGSEWTSSDRSHLMPICMILSSSGPGSNSLSAGCMSSQPSPG